MPINCEVGIRVKEEPLQAQVPLDRHSSTEVWAAIDQIRTSRIMSRCATLMRLLTFVVEATLKGEAADLKETTIGVFVFGRQPDYDPRVDAIVRSQAWRLRVKLLKYYATEGVRDPVIVSVPLGYYIPVFQHRHASY